VADFRCSSKYLKRTWRSRRGTIATEQSMSTRPATYSQHGFHGSKAYIGKLSSLQRISQTSRAKCPRPTLDDISPLPIRRRIDNTQVRGLCSMSVRGFGLSSKRVATLSRTSWSCKAAASVHRLPSWKDPWLNDAGVVKNNLMPNVS